MCGRFVRKLDLREAMAYFNAAVMESDLGPSYNIAPRQPIAVIMERGERKIVSMQWGLIPHWAKDEKIGNKLINARCETIAFKPSFRNAYKNRRCLIIADGFYEWREIDMHKRPYYICMKDEKPFGMAGLYETWSDPGGKKITTCTIITTTANDLMKPIHHRMPVIIDPDDYDLWLDPEETDTSKLEKMLRPCDPGMLKAYEVGPQVNAAGHVSEDCIKPVQG